jgi:type IV secretory pathway protease TraF
VGGIPLVVAPLYLDNARKSNRKHWSLCIRLFCRSSRAAAIGCVIGLLCVEVAAGPAINGDGASFPVGLYLVTGKSPDKGYLVFVNPTG